MRCCIPFHDAVYKDAFQWHGMGRALQPPPDISARVVWRSWVCVLLSLVSSLGVII